MTCVLKISSSKLDKRSMKKDGVDKGNWIPRKYVDKFILNFALKLDIMKTVITLILESRKRLPVFSGVQH